jgi:hypothetical protein
LNTNSYGAWTRPRPTSTIGSDSARELAINLCHKAAPRAPVACAQRAAIPATWGVAILVSLIVRYRVGIGQEE